MKLFVSLWLLFVTSGVAETIKIAVAANVSYAMDSLKEAFLRENPDVDVKITLGSSGKLTAQIHHGAPYDLFMSADMKYPQFLFDAKKAVTKPKIYAQGALALLSQKKRDFSKGIKCIVEDDVSKIAIANPKIAPYGYAAVEAMKKDSLYVDVVKKFIYAESVSQVITYTLSAADVGFVAKSSLFSPHMAQYTKGEHWMDVNSTHYEAINQGVVILKRGASKQTVEQFYTFLFSDQGQKILRDFGYGTP